MNEYKKTLQEQLGTVREIVKAEHAAYENIKKELENSSPKPSAIGVDKYMIDFDLSILDDVPTSVEDIENELEKYEELLASIQKLIDDIRRATMGIAEFNTIRMPQIKTKYPTLDINSIIGVDPLIHTNIPVSVNYKVSKEIDSVDGNVIED
jgi:hypothetical protein